ncbi:hypothetical protein PR202_gb00195 [Eleusine coracana subsp. coracana]|uniref:Uncharacterized protein n=1 Tax=Eleusine coracana subsp. coracana TaxID=191504 RepID=A0AAV5DT18_ELECO|nr:hypothetical protein PR202_gb00195 [Eleusine coracana subsp. coracana]
MKDSKGIHDYDGSEFDRETFSLHDKLSTQLSLYSSNGVLLKDTAVSPGSDNEVPSDILHWPLKNLRQNPDREEVTKWRLDKNGFSLILSDSELYADSSSDSSVSEQSSIISSPCVSLAAYSDRSEDLDRTDIWVSCLDLDEEDSALLPEKEQFLDIFSSEFPSLSFRAVRSLQLGSSNSNPGTSQREEVSSSDDPIFWPFDRTSYNSPELDKFLSVSPRRNTLGIRCGQVRQLNPVQRLQKNKLSSAMKGIQPQRSSMSASERTTASQDKIKNTDTTPSRLSIPAKTSASSKHQPVRNCEKKRPPHLKIGTSRKVNSPRLQIDRPHQEIKIGKIRSLVNKKSAIEELIGLDEFDGHEGINSNSKDYQFSMRLSPR